MAYAHDSADAYIEREVRAMRKEGKQVWAATNDGGIQTACSLHNATVVSAKWLVNELKASRKAGAAVLDEFNKRQARLSKGGVRGVTLWDAIDSGLRNELDAEIERGATSGLSRKQREAMESIKAGGAPQAPARCRPAYVDKAAAAARRRRAARAEGDDDFFGTASKL